MDAQNDLGLSFAADVDGLDNSTSQGLCLSFRTLTTTVPGLGDVDFTDVVCEQNGSWTMYFDGSAQGFSATSNHNLSAISINNGVLYFSTHGLGAIPGVSSPYDKADIYSWDGANFARVFDASTMGLQSHADIDGLKFIDSDTFYLSFSRDDSNGGTVLPDSTVAYDEDIVLYDAGTWSVYFDGTAQGFDSNLNGQDIDALDLISAPPLNNVTTFSTLGNASIPGVASPYDNADIYSWDETNFAREMDALNDLGLSSVADVDGLDNSTSQGLCLSFRTQTTTVPSLGDVDFTDVVCEQNGSWSMYFDGSAQGFSATSNHNLSAISINNGVLYFSTHGLGAIPGVASPYDDADIYSWDGTSFTRVFDASTAGLQSHANIDGLKFIDNDTFYLSFSRDDSYGGTVLPDSTVAYDEDIVLYGIVLKQDPYFAVVVTKAQ